MKLVFYCRSWRSSTQVCGEMALCLLLLGLAVTFTCVSGTTPPSDGSGTEESTQVACLSRSDNVTLTFDFPETCESKKVIVLEHGGRELLIWTAPCNTNVHPLYKDRVIETCEESTCRLTLTLLRLTEKDSGTLQCRDGALGGTVLSSLHLQVLAGLEDLSHVCSYWSNNRTVSCEIITQEVRIYRIGENGDRDIRYFNKAFSYTLKNHEYGQFAVTRTKESRDDKFCSQEFRFQVETHIEDDDNESFTKRYAISISSILIVFSIVFLFGCDIIIDLCRSRY